MPPRRTVAVAVVNAGAAGPNGVTVEIGADFQCFVRAVSRLTANDRMSGERRRSNRGVQRHQQPCVAFAAGRLSEIRYGAVVV